MAGSPFWDGYNNGFAAVQQVRQQGAIRKMQQDPQGGMNDLQVVNPELANAFAQQKQQQQQYEQQQQARAARVHSGEMAADGNYTGAMNEAYRAGDFEGGDQLRQTIAQMSKQDKEAAALQVQNTGAFAYGLMQVPAEQRQAWAQANAQRFGMDVSKIDPAHLDDASLRSDVARAAGIQNMLDYDAAEDRIAANPYQAVSNGGVLVDRQTGEVVARNAKTFAPARGSSKASKTSPWAMDWSK